MNKVREQIFFLFPIIPLCCFLIYEYIYTDKNIQCPVFFSVTHAYCCLYHDVTKQKSNQNRLSDHVLIIYYHLKLFL